MDELTYLILERFHIDTNCNWDAVIGLIRNNADYFAYDEEDAASVIGRLQIRKMIFEVPAIAKGFYTISEEGRKLYLKEKKSRDEKQRSEELQKELSTSVIDANASVIQTNDTVIQTNESVRQTNVSVQAINKIVSENIPRQNRLALSSVIVAIVAAVVLLASLLAPIFYKSDSAILKQLEDTNKVLKEQNQEIKKLLQHQTSIDSVLLRNRDSLLGR